MQITPETILGVVSKHTHFTPQQITSRLRTSDVCFARYMCFKLISDNTMWSYGSITRFLGINYGSGVKRGLVILENIIETDQRRRSAYEAIQKEISCLKDS